MSKVLRIPYSTIGGNPQTLMPRFSLILNNEQNSLEVTGLVDSGSVLNVILFTVGQNLGFIWEHQTVPIHLGGVYSGIEARGVFVSASHTILTENQPIDMVFAWANSDKVSLVFGRTNFFQAFDVCFFGIDEYFEITRR